MQTHWCVLLLFRITHVALFWLVAAGMACADAYDPPANYYAGVTGTGAALKSQLTAAMSANQIQRTYGDYRFSAAIQDRDPNNSNNIRLVYNNASVSGVWDSAVTWNREHLWPESRQPGTVNNSSTGNLGDPHALRPSDPQINADRGNLPFGLDGTTGAYRPIGSVWYPGDVDKGDVARSLFYSDTRWGSTGLSLTDASPSGFQMGDLSSLIAWNYLDPPDDFERRRNHTIFSQSLNPQYYTNNRNAYTDRPEYVWSVYVDQQNDAAITVRGGTGSGGATTLNLNLGSALVGGPLPSNQTVTIDKAGIDGTFYSVTRTGQATSSVEGRNQAFPIGSSGSRSITVGLSTTTSTAGLRTGSVVVDNLDITTGGGLGRGANDGNDTIQLSYYVFDHARPSFSPAAQMTTLIYDFGTYARGGTPDPLAFNLFNLEATPGFTARLELDSIIPIGASSAFQTDLTTLLGGQSIAAGPIGVPFQAHFDTSRLGSFQALYQLNFSDENLPGAQATTTMNLVLLGNVIHRFSLNELQEDNGLIIPGKMTFVPEPNGVCTWLVLLAIGGYRCLQRQEQAGNNKTRTANLGRRSDIC